MPKASRGYGREASSIQHVSCTAQELPPWALVNAAAAIDPSGIVLQSLPAMSQIIPLSAILDLPNGQLKGYVDISVERISNVDIIRSELPY